MPRSTDVNDIKTDQRVFIDTMNEWSADESREFYYTGHEKVDQISKAGKPYTNYYIYLLKIVDGKVGGEETLRVLAFQAQGLKICGVKEYQKLTITRQKDGNYDVWEFTAGQEILPQKNRPAPIEYPEIKTAVAPTPIQEEINIEDIAF